MADLDQFIARAAVVQAAIATLGASAAWDRAIAEYLRCAALSHASFTYGPAAIANEDYERAELNMQRAYGPTYRLNPAAQDVLQPLLAAVRWVEDETSTLYGSPLWEAQRVLVTTPAPTVAAAAFKALLIEADDIWSDGQLETGCMQIIAEDFARLARGGEATFDSPC